MLVGILVVLLSAFLFYFILNIGSFIEGFEISGFLKFILIAVEMFIVGKILSKRYKLDTEIGLILLKSKKGLEFIEKISQYKKLWNFLADLGVTISYGAIGTLMMRRNASWPTFILGMILLSAILFFIAPLALHFLSTVITGSIFEDGPTMSLGGEQLTAIFLLAVTLLGGFFLSLMVGLVYYGVYILTLVFQFIFLGGSDLLATQPGGTLLLPGVNLPFFEGIIALIIVLVVHEGAHAILSRIASVPLKSSGIVLFGIIPIGAFVEPDENILRGTPQREQTRVLVGGSTANFLTSVVCFSLFIPLAILLSGLEPGTAVLYLILRFLYIALGLAFSLNFIVATVNLLPLPLFDGYRILEVNIPKKIVVNALMYITLIAFLLNFLPWLFAK